RLFPKSRLLQDAAELAHLAPEHAHRPMLDVEIMVLHEWKHRPCKPELALEGSAGVAGEHVGIFGSDPVALLGDFLGRTVDGFARRESSDVIADEAERNVEVLDPVFIGGIEAVAGREIEPGILRLLPGREPFGAARMFG